MEKTLVRNTRNQTLGGVCSGIATYLGWDVTLVRVVTVLLTIFTGGTALVAYVILWIVMPADYTVYGPGPQNPYQQSYDQGYWAGYNAGHPEGENADQNHQSYTPN
jgi:Putative stress-responsive transcriptional regulator